MFRVTMLASAIMAVATIPILAVRTTSIEAEVIGDPEDSVDITV